MTVNYPGPTKNWICLTGALLLLVLVFVIIFTSNSWVRQSPIFASERKNTVAEGTAGDANTPAKREQKARGKKTVPRPEHTHPAFSEHSEQRAKMVRRHMQARGISDPNVLASLRTVPRHAFVRANDLRRAYADHPLPIGFGQTISQPYIVAYMTEALKLRPEHKVLEIGTGSGYQAAVCGEIAKEVYTIEIIEQLAEAAGERLKKLGYKNITVKAGDGYFGWKEKGRFDAIIVTAVAGFVPPPLIEQLKPGGRMILPLGSPFGLQTLVLITKDEKEKLYSRELLPVRFVPMVGEITRAKKPRKK